MWQREQLDYVDIIRIEISNIKNMTLLLEKGPNQKDVNDAMNAYIRSMRNNWNDQSIGTERKNFPSW